MSDEQPFAAENPFRKLDKKRFQSAGDKKDKQATVARNAKKKQADAEVSPFGDAEDAGTFLAAVSGATPLGTPAKPTFRKQAYTPPLDNPLLEPFQDEQALLTRNVFQKQKALGTVSVARPGSRLETPSLPTPTEEVPTEEAPPDYGVVTPLSRRESTRQKSREAVQRSVALVPPMLESEPDDGTAFFSAVKDVRPLSGRGREVPPEIPVSAPIFVEESTSLQDSMDEKLEFALAFTEDYMEGHVIGLDLMTVGKLQAGQSSPEAHIDLHGMNTQQAFQALVGFFRGAYLKGLRTLLVVPGRGLNSPQGVSILRDKLQDWLTQEPFRRVVLAFCTAKPVDGGAGALYVLLRKYRKDHGKVCWDRKPADPDLL